VSALPEPMLSVPALDPPVFMAAEFPKPVFRLPELKNPYLQHPNEAWRARCLNSRFPRRKDRRFRYLRSRCPCWCCPNTRRPSLCRSRSRIRSCRRLRSGTKISVSRVKEADVVVTRVPEPDVADARIEIDADLTVAATTDADVPVSVFGKPILLLPLFPKSRLPVFPKPKLKNAVVPVADASAADVVPPMFPMPDGRRPWSLAALEPHRQIIGDCVHRDPLLRHGVALAHGDGAVFE
jgi:hypothetical protein